MANKDNKNKLAVATGKSFNSSDSDNKVDKSDINFVAAGDDVDRNDIQNDNENLQKAIHAMQKIATNEQEVIAKITSEYMTVVKFSLANARRIWTAAAAWSSGVHKESVEYADAMGDVAAEQLYTNMESIH